MVGRLLSFWDGNFFSGELLVLGNVTRWWFQILATLLREAFQVVSVAVLTDLPGVLCHG